MNPRDRKQVEAAIRQWRKAHPTAEARRQAYLRSVPKQVADSMAFECEPVDLEILETRLKVLLGGA